LQGIEFLLTFSVLGLLGVADTMERAVFDGTVICEWPWSTMANPETTNPDDTAVERNNPNTTFMMNDGWVIPRWQCSVPTRFYELPRMNSERKNLFHFEPGVCRNRIHNLESTLSYCNMLSSNVVRMGLSLRSTVASTGRVYHILWWSVREKRSCGCSQPEQLKKKRSTTLLKNPNSDTTRPLGLIRHRQNPVSAWRLNGLYFARMLGRYEKRT
jgi:hypothetical protein